MINKISSIAPAQYMQNKNQNLSKSEISFGLTTKTISGKGIFGFSPKVLAGPSGEVSTMVVKGTGNKPWYILDSGKWVSNTRKLDNEFVLVRCGKNGGQEMYYKGLDNEALEKMGGLNFHPEPKASKNGHFYEATDDKGLKYKLRINNTKNKMELSGIDFGGTGYEYNISETSMSPSDKATFKSLVKKLIFA